MSGKHFSLLVCVSYVHDGDDVVFYLYARGVLKHEELFCFILIFCYLIIMDFENKQKKIVLLLQTI